MEINFLYLLTILITEVVTSKARILFRPNLKKGGKTFLILDFCEVELGAKADKESKKCIITLSQ